MDLMFVISQICSLDIRLQVHFNHILTLRTQEIWNCVSYGVCITGNQLRSVKLPLCCLLPCRGLIYCGGSRVMVPIMHFSSLSPSQTIGHLFVSRPDP